MPVAISLYALSNENKIGVSSADFISGRRGCADPYKIQKKPGDQIGHPEIYLHDLLN